MAKTGRPRTKINQKNFETLCAMQCTEIEICCFFECCEDTLNAWCKRTYKDEDGKPMTFSEVFQQKRERGKASLRRAQWKKAVEEGNTTMLIFLGKQFLGQKDNPDIVVQTGSLADAIEEAYQMHKNDDSNDEEDGDQ